MNIGLIEEILESIGLEKLPTDSNPAGNRRENRREAEEIHACDE